MLLIYAFLTWGLAAAWPKGPYWISVVGMHLFWGVIVWGIWSHDYVERKERRGD